MNKNLFILYVVSSVVSLLWILLLYFGIVRYIKLNLYCCDKFSEMYLKLPRVNSKNKVIVSIYTKEPNLNKIKKVINSILDQTVHPDQIIINTAPDMDIQLPDFIKNNNIIITHKLANDYGDISNIISPLLREKNGDTIIILVDDTTIYGTDLIESLVEESEQHPESVIYTSGYVGKQYVDTGKKIDVHGSNDIIDCSFGVLVKPKFFDENIINDIQPNIINDPNIFLSTKLSKNKTNIRQIDYKDNMKTTSSINPKEKNNIILNAAYLKSFN